MNINGKEVRNPVVRAFVVMLLVAALVAIFFVGATIFFTLIGIVTVFLVFSLLLHFTLQLLGRRGFYRHDDGTQIWGTSTNVRLNGAVEF